MKNWSCQRLALLVIVLMPHVQAASFIPDLPAGALTHGEIGQPGLKQFTDPPDKESDIQNNSKDSPIDPLDAHANLLCKKGTCMGRCWDSGWLTIHRPTRSARRKRLPPPLINTQQVQSGGLNEDGRQQGDDQNSTGPVWENDASDADEQKNKSEGQTNFDTQCTCDENCFIFGDCCYDFFSLCLQQNLTSLLYSVHNTSGIVNIMQDIKKSKNIVGESVLMYLFKSCEEIDHGTGTQHYWMISSCSKLNTEETLDDTKIDIVSKCHNTSLDPLGSVPVTLRQQPDIVFRNIFCAQCNGVDKESVMLWPSEAKCPGLSGSSGITYDEFMHKLRASLCRVVSEVPAKARPRPCRQDHDTHHNVCPTHGVDRSFSSLNSLMCRSYIYPIVTDTGVKVRNSHCATCSTNDTFRKFTCETLSHFRFHSIKMPYCHKHSCKGFCHIKTTDQDCHCDIKCMTYGDCCYDFISTCHSNSFTFTEFADNETLINALLMQAWKPVEHDTKTRTNTKGFEDTMIQTTETVIQLQALYIRYRSCVLIPQGNMIWVIAKCPRNKEDPLCESPPSITNYSMSTPASFIHDVDIVFKNIYCGRCHGVPEEKLIQWDRSISCKPESHRFTNIEEYLSGYCKIHMERMGGRSCMDVDINHPIRVRNDSEAISLCRSYRYTVYSNTQRRQYRNPHCVQLHHGEGDVSCTLKTLDDEFDKKHIAPSADGSSSFSILFNFNDKDVRFQTKDGKLISPRLECQSDEVYDTYEKICRKIRCQEGKEAINGTCLISGVVFADSQNQLFPNGTLHFLASMYVLTELPLQINNVMTLFGLKDVHEIHAHIEILDVSSLPSDISFHSVEWESSQDLKQMVRIYIENGRSLEHFLSIMAQRILRKSDLVIVDIILQNYYLESDLLCSYGEVMQMINVTLETLNGTLYATDSYKYYTLDSVAFVLGLKNEIPNLHKIFVCGIPLNCDPAVYNLTDFIQEEGNLRNLHSGVILTNTSFFIMGEEVLSCHNFTQSEPERHSHIFFKYDHIQGILTYVTSGVSLVSLLITLVVYSLLPQLRNLPGRLTMSLSASLLVAQTLLLLIQLPTGVLCQALAIAMHFSWLCSFMWMTVMSVTLARTFTNKGVNALNQNTAKAHGFLSLCANGIPLCIVTTSALLDFMEVPNIYIGYGAHGICWIANPRASLLVFGVPLALMLLVNIIAFIMTLCNIEKSLKLSENITSSKKDKAKVIIYGKLFVIMGVSWCFSFGAAFADVSILWYIFIILNGLQGFYIFVSFVCTDRVTRLLREKLTGSTADFRTTSAVTSSTEIKSQKGDKTSI